MTFSESEAVCIRVSVHGHGKDITGIFSPPDPRKKERMDYRTLFVVVENKIILETGLLSSKLHNDRSEPRSVP